MSGIRPRLGVPKPEAKGLRWSNRGTSQEAGVNGVRGEVSTIQTARIHSNNSQGGGTTPAGEDDGAPGVLRSVTRRMRSLEHRAGQAGELPKVGWDPASSENGQHLVTRPS